jgi:hypothetical protein
MYKFLSLSPSYRSILLKIFFFIPILDYHLNVDYQNLISLFHKFTFIHPINQDIDFLNSTPQFIPIILITSFNPLNA